MRKSRFTDEQMVAIPREAEKTSFAEAVKKHAVSFAFAMLPDAGAAGSEGSTR